MFMCVCVWWAGQEKIILKYSLTGGDLCKENETPRHYLSPKFLLGTGRKNPSHLEGSSLEALPWEDDCVLGLGMAGTSLFSGVLRPRGDRPALSRPSLAPAASASPVVSGERELRGIAGGH